MELAEYAGKRFTLVLTDAQDESTAFAGWTAFLSGEELLLQRPDSVLSVEPAWVPRIRAIDSERLQGLLPDADFYLPLLIEEDLKGGLLPTAMPS
jgi:hypothetical protein